MTNSSSSFPALAGVFDRFAAFFYPEICQICKNEPARANEGFVGAQCWTKPDGVQFVTEPFCRCCGLPFDGDIGMAFECGNCREQQLHFRSARAAVKLTGLVQDVIHRYKYNQANWFEPFLADLLIRQARPKLKTEDWDFIAPIPLHWLKLRERSFNQSHRMAKMLSKAIGIPVNTRLLRRKEPTPTQTRLTRAQRAENVKRAFAFRGRKPLEGDRIVLVDDVLTTGATANACAKLLMQNGASVVDVWTVARGMLQ
ncbi:MAG TPA: ComF family protein [Verrucomicrobiae bacterium]|nr:ComF family protein [Verrucomicrobiae bacterium]